MSEWRRFITVEVQGDTVRMPGLADAADAVLDIAHIEAPTKRQRAGALLIAGALIRMNRS